MISILVICNEFISLDKLMKDFIKEWTILISRIRIDIVSLKREQKKGKRWLKKHLFRMLRLRPINLV